MSARLRPCVRSWRLLALAPAPGRAEALSPRSDLADLAFQPHPGAHLPLDAALVDEDGPPVPLGRLFLGKPVMLVLDYLRCKTLCGFDAGQLARRRSARCRSMPAATIRSSRSASIRATHRPMRGRQGASISRSSSRRG